MLEFLICGIGLGLLLSIIVLFVLIITPDNDCPHCKSIIPVGATVCKECGRDVTIDEDEAAA